MAMLMGSRTRGRSRRRSGRRTGPATEWVPAVTAFSLSPATPFICLPLIPNATITELTEPVYWGGHLEVFARADIIDDVPATGVVALGLRVLSQRTVTTADPASVPLPFSDGEGDWPWLRYIALSSFPGVYLGTNIFSDIAGTVRFHDLLRAKRRLTEDDEVALVAELLPGPPITSTGQICFVIGSRLLLRQK